MGLEQSAIDRTSLRCSTMFISASPYKWGLLRIMTFASLPQTQKATAYLVPNTVTLGT